MIEQGKASLRMCWRRRPTDIEFSNGRFVICRHRPRHRITELAENLRCRAEMPEGAPSSLDCQARTEANSLRLPKVCHVAEIEIDPDPGEIEVVNYSSVNDFGTIVNPLLVEYLVHGGVVQGFGQALLELAVYNEEGQLLSGSYMDYAMPRAHHLPGIGFVSHPVPAKSNPLGTKGCGEAGCAGALASIINAVVDALSVYGDSSHRQPSSPRASGARCKGGQRPRLTQGACNWLRRRWRPWRWLLLNLGRFIRACAASAASLASRGGGAARGSFRERPGPRPRNAPWPFGPLG